MSGQSDNSKPANAAPSAAERVAAHVSGLDWRQATPEAVAAVRAFTLDTLGVGIAGARSPYAPGVLATAREWGEGGHCNVFGGGDGRSMPAASAAFVNAFQAHALEYDCVHEAAVLHPFTVVVPVLAAEAASRPAEDPLTGEDCVAATLAGVDVAAGLGCSALTAIRFFRPATCGLFGATAALARARRMDAATTAHALGYALAFAAGTMQAHVEGTPALAASVGAAARSAFTAVGLAQAGLPGPTGSLDGPFGYAALFETRADLSALLDGLGRVWRAAETSWKPWPTGRAAHGGIDMVLSMRAQGLTPERLERLVFHVPPLIGHLVGRPAPERGALEVNYARLCLPWAAALALATGGVTLQDFEPERLADPALRALAGRIEVRVSDVADPAAFVPQRAEALTTDEQILRAAVDILPGAPGRPLTRAAHLDKFRQNAAFGFGRPRPEIEAALIAACDRLETLPDTRVLACLACGIHP